jgi:hypothetical protein
MKSVHPYENIPSEKLWKSFVPQQSWRDLKIADEAKFKINPGSKIATAGSCFAQHIAKFLKNTGKSAYIVEKPHPILDSESQEYKSYELYTARYGNIYTARQCLELYLQAFGLIPMVEDYCIEDEKIYDLMRPQAVPEGFSSINEYREDRNYHLSCVRSMFENSDIFVFTLGLTEAWFNKLSGHTYPVCPGTAKGVFDSEKHFFHNFNYSEIMADMEHLIERLALINPTLKIILTVSPVSLVATNTRNNVLLASSYSKSVLRAVCGDIHEKYSNVQYFPSYEIINHCASFGQYLSDNLRDVSPRGIEHVMSVFDDTFMTGPHLHVSDNYSEGTLDADKDSSLLQFIEVECEELMNDFSRKNEK